ncbi:hypothetical protein HDE_04857 [Halotydeus destructor]|nr:hypothetical protein HDE_04857 [Halotydeus destructor]
MVYCHVVDDKKTYQSRDPIGFSFTQSPTRLSHWIKSVLYKVYGHVDFTKNPLDRNKVDYVCRIVFPITYLIFIIVYMCIFLFPWLASRYDLY